MRTIFLLPSFLIFIPISLFAQSIDALENNNGFKSIKINSHISEFKNNLEFVENKNGYTTYKYIDGYEIQYETKHIYKKESIYKIAKRYKTEVKILDSLNPKIRKKGAFVKRNQELIVPVKKIIGSQTRDKSLLGIYGNTINFITLTFENKSNKLKKITLNLSDRMSIGHLRNIGYYLKELYTEFEERIGQTTEYPKPTKDCYKYKQQSCIYFEDRIKKGKILWKSKSIVLQIYHDYALKPKYNHYDSYELEVIRVITFKDRKYYQYIESTGF